MGYKFYLLSISEYSFVIYRITNDIITLDYDIMIFFAQDSVERHRWGDRNLLLLSYQERLTAVEFCHKKWGAI